MATPRVRPAFRLASILACIVLLPLALHAAWDYVEARRLSRRVEAIRARGERVHFGTYREGRPVTPEQKQASRYYGAAAILARDAFGRPADEIAATIDALAKEPIETARRDPRLEDLRRVEQEYWPALDLIDRASVLDARGLDYGHETRYGFPELGLSNVNRARIARLAFEGDGDRAARALLSTLRMRRAFDDFEMLTQAVRTDNALWLVLTFSTPSESLLADVQHDLERWDDDDQIARRLIQSRAQLLEASWPGAYGEMSSLPRLREPAGRPYSSLLFFALRPYVTHRIAGMLRLYDEALHDARLPWPERIRAAADMAARLPLERRPFGTRPTGLSAAIGDAGGWPGTIPARVPAELKRITDATALELARRRVAEATIAIERFRRASGGRVPSDLAALVPTYLRALPVDSFSGHPIRYTAGPRSYKVYSVGPDGTDDGGTWSDAMFTATGARQELKDVGLEIRTVH